jgi:uroporphyrinogen-III synthase
VTSSAALIDINVFLTQDDSGDLSRLLKAAGASVSCRPMIQIAPPVCFDCFAAEVTRIREYDWVVFASATAVRSVSSLLPKLSDAGAIGAQWAAVGPATAAELSRQGVRVDLVPQGHSATGLIAAFRHLSGGPFRILLPQSQIADDTLADGLRAIGNSVTRVDAYTIRTDPAAVEYFARSLADERIDAVIATSPSNLRPIAEVLQKHPDVPVVTLGRRTLAEGHRLQLRAVVAADADGLAVVEAVANITARPSV